MTLWGIGTEANQARTLCAEVDRVERLDDLGDLVAAAPGSQIAMASRAIPAEAIDESEARSTASSFARNWATKATTEEVSDLLAARPRIPSALDAELLRAAVQAIHGNLRGHDMARRAVRDAFWAGLSRRSAAEAADRRT